MSTEVQTATIFPNAGLMIRSPDGGHALVLRTEDDQTALRELVLKMGDQNATLTITGDAVIPEPSGGGLGVSLGVYIAIQYKVVRF